MSIKFPRWLYDRVWNIAVFRAVSGVNINIQSWRLVQHNTPVFRYCEEGNIQAFRKLLAEGSASPRDRSDLNFTLLDVGMLCTSGTSTDS